MELPPSHYWCGLDGIIRRLRLAVSGWWEEGGGRGESSGGDPEMKANRALGVQIRLDRSASVGCWGESPGEEACRH